MSKKLFSLVLLLFSTAALLAQKVAFEATAPAVVEAGEVFRVEFSVTGSAAPEGFTPPDINGFSVLAGPTVSRGQSMSIVNGNMSTSVNYTYTYVFQATAEGRFAIPSAEVKVEGKSYTSKPLTIEVVASSAGGQGQQQGTTGEARDRQGARAKNALAPDDLILTATVSRSSVYKGQPIKLTWKLYQRAQVSGALNQKIPAFNGFWSQEIPSAGKQQWTRETYNSKVYDAMVLGEYLLYPQQSGVLQIDPFSLTVVVQIITQARRQSVFDDFFGGGPSVEEVQKELRTQPLKITVKDFPAGAPAGFNGAVGDFTLTGGVSAQDITANSAATYQVKIAGAGNLPLIQAPKLSMPGSFEQYNTTTKESFTSNSSGISGYRQFEYPFIARAEGEYVVEPVEFSFFNPETARYITLTLPAATLKVAPGAGGSPSAGGGIVSGLTKEEIKILGKDIRFIKIGSLGRSAANFIVIGSWGYFAVLALLAGLFVYAFTAIGRHIKQSGNAAAMKGKRANKAALQRLRTAECYMAGGDSRRFLDEMLRALWGYLGDKLNIPAANLTKDNVREELSRRRVSQQLSERYMGVIADCELAQYSPATTGRTGELYCEGIAVISEMETILKR